MKRDIFLKSNAFAVVLKWLLAFMIGMALFVLLLFALTGIQMKWKLNNNILQIILMVIFTISCAVTALLFQKFTKIKGYICGLVTGGTYSLIKLIMSLSSEGVGKGNFAIYLCLMAAALLSGILSANQRNKVKW